MPLPLNTPAPEFSLPSTSGKNFNLKDYRGTSLILFFYPKDFTRGCTLEVCSFRDNFKEFKGLDIPVFGISTDSIQSHLKFKKEHQLPFELLSDESGQVSRDYKARIPFLNISGRVTYLLDKEHNVAAVHDSLFSAGDHISRMLSEIN